MHPDSLLRDFLVMTRHTSGVVANLFCQLYSAFRQASALPWPNSAIEHMRAVLRKTVYSVKAKLVGHTHFAHAGHPPHPAIWLVSGCVHVSSIL